jgi:hypothetical protein
VIWLARRFSIFLVAMLFVGCGSSPATPAPNYTRGDVAQCDAANDISILEPVYFGGDVAAARAEWTGWITDRLDWASGVSVTGAAAAEWRAALDAMRSTKAAISSPMTEPQFRTATDALDAPLLAFEHKCNDIRDWVNAYVPQ